MPTLYPVAVRDTVLAKKYAKYAHYLQVPCNRVVDWQGDRFQCSQPRPRYRSSPDSNRQADHQRESSSVRDVPPPTPRRRVLNGKIPLALDGSSDGRAHCRPARRAIHAAPGCDVALALVPQSKACRGAIV
eukprot:7120698-Prymnesium_polylepis.1